MREIESSSQVRQRQECARFYDASAVDHAVVLNGTAARDQCASTNFAVRPDVAGSHQARAAMNPRSGPNPNTRTNLLAYWLNRGSERKAIENQTAEICRVLQTIGVAARHEWLRGYSHFRELVAHEERSVVTARRGEHEQLQCTVLFGYLGYMVALIEMELNE